jgi:hypothetical protein
MVVTPGVLGSTSAVIRTGRRPVAHRTAPYPARSCVINEIRKLTDDSTGLASTSTSQTKCRELRDVHARRGPAFDHRALRRRQQLFAVGVQPAFHRRQRTRCRFHALRFTVENHREILGHPQPITDGRGSSLDTIPAEPQ